MKQIARVLACLGLGLVATTASAGQFVFSTPTPANTGEGVAANNVTVTVSYTAGANEPVVGVDALVPAAFANIETSSPNCTVDNPTIPGVVRISLIDINGVNVPSTNPVCVLTFDISAMVAPGTYNFSTCTAMDDADCGGTTVATVNYGAGFVVVPNVGPTIVAGSPAFGSDTAVAGGTIGGADVTRNISFGASSGGSGAGTTDLVCMTDIGALTNGTQNNVAIGATPTTMQFSIAPAAMQRIATISCTATPDGGGMAQMFSYTLTIAAGSVLTGPTLNPPAQTTLSVGAGAIGSSTSAQIVYTATGGDAMQTTALTCMSTGTVVIVSGGNQNVTTGSNPVPVVVSVQLTDAQQNPAGTVTCSANGNDTVFTINAPAGLLFVPPEVVPASSLWSQLALIGLLAALGGMIVALRRNA